MREFNFMTRGEFVRTVENKQSGVYLIRDKGNRVVYVGKAVDLKHRIKDHFNGCTNTKPYSMFFNEVAFVIENSSIKRSLLETQLMFEYKPIFNIEVQEEFPDLYNDYLTENSEVYKGFDRIREVNKMREESRRSEEALSRDKLRKDLIKMVGGKAVFYDILSYLDNGYNPHFLAESLQIEIETIKKIQGIRHYLRIPQAHKRTIKHTDLVHAVTGKQDTANARLNHLL